MTNIGIICPSDIALRRFMPALQKVEGLNYVGVGIYNLQERCGGNVSEEEGDAIIKAEFKKAQAFAERYGGVIFDSYESAVTDGQLDAVYIPLPPALHFCWARRALESGKHVLLEKPSTLSYQDTCALVGLARKKGLALHENYMFIFHDQIKALENMVSSGEIGEVRLYRISFGFPMRGANDFRYNKQLGGGALYDAGGYVLKYASMLLGDTAKIKYAVSNHCAQYDVDLYGSAALVNEDGVTAQVSFGMDNQYKCELEVWGSKGTIKTDRVLTAPDGFIPKATVTKGNDVTVVDLPADDAFHKSIEHFLSCVRDEALREQNYARIERQAALIDRFKAMAEEGK